MIFLSSIIERSRIQDNISLENFSVLIIIAFLFYLKIPLQEMFLL